MGTMCLLAPQNRPLGQNVLHIRTSLTCAQYNALARHAIAQKVDGTHSVLRVGVRCQPPTKAPCPMSKEIESKKQAFKEGRW
jgi:hypothetical protein